MSSPVVRTALYTGKKWFKCVREGDVVFVTHEYFFGGRSEGNKTELGFYRGISSEHTLGTHWQAVLSVPIENGYRETCIDLVNIREIRPLDMQAVVKMLNEMRPMFGALFASMWSR